MTEKKTRVSKTRGALLAILSKANTPLSVSELLELLDKSGRGVNKTTVYREIQFLLSQNIIVAVFIDETHSKYELNTSHHHHLVCRRCGLVKEIEIKQIEKSFELFEKKLTERSKFTDVFHNLEFFGLCKKCSLVS